jgi:hypothetical protein
MKDIKCYKKQLFCRSLINSHHSRAVAGTVSDYGPDDRGSIPSRSKGFFLCVQTGSEAHPVSHPTGTGSLFPGVKHSRDVTQTSPPPIAEVTNE